MDVKTDNQSASITNIHYDKHIAVVAVCAVLCTFSACLAVFAAYTSMRSEKETRMLEYYVNEVDGKLIHAGFIEPRDRWSPEKRKQYEEKKP